MTCTLRYIDVRYMLYATPSIIDYELVSNGNDISSPKRLEFAREIHDQSADGEEVIVGESENINPI